MKDSYYQGKTEEILSELGRKIDILIKETKTASGDVKQGLEDRIEEIRKNKQELENELQGLGRNHEGKWRAMENHLSNAAEEVKEAIRIVFSRETVEDSKKE